MFFRLILLSGLGSGGGRYGIAFDLEVALKLLRFDILVIGLGGGAFLDLLDQRRSVLGGFIRPPYCESLSLMGEGPSKELDDRAHLRIYECVPQDHLLLDAFLRHAVYL